MWGFKQSSGIDQPLRKFLDASRDSLKRLKSFKQVLEKLSQPEKKPFFEKHHEHIFFIIYSSFTTIETCLQSRGSKKSHDSYFSELSKTILPSLETLIILLPEKLYNKWQYNGVCSMIHKVLHPENDLTLRCYGIKLLVLFMLATQDNGDDACLELFSTAVPGFPPPLVPVEGEPVDDSKSEHSSSVVQRYGSYSPNENTTWWDSTPGIGDVISIAKVKPLYMETNPANVKVPRTRYLMDCLMHLITSQVGRIQWADPNLHLRGFAYLFHQLKLRYLAPLYKEFRGRHQLYATAPGSANLSSISPLSSPSSSSSTPKLPTKGDRMSAIVRLAYDTSDPIYTQVKQLVLQKVLNWLMYKRSDQLLVNLPDELTQDMLLSGSFPSQLSGVELLNKILFSTRGNITLLLEMLRQGFNLPLRLKVPHQIVDLYHCWLEKEDKPIFMLDPTQSDKETSDSWSLSWEVLEGSEPSAREELRVGLQVTLRMFIEHTRYVFSIKEQGKMERSSLAVHVDLCKKVIELYQVMAKKWLLDEESWLHLLDTLLDITVNVMEEVPPLGGTPTLSYQLAELLMKTLLVSYVRASMAVSLPSTLWDRLQDVLVKRKEWKVVIVSWQEHVELITQVLGQVLYGLDLKNLPLVQLEQRRQGRQGGQQSGALTIGEPSPQGAQTNQGRKQEVASHEGRKQEVATFKAKKQETTPLLLSATAPIPAPPTSPSSRTVGRRLSFRRGRYSHGESLESSHRYWDRPHPERSHVPIGKNVSISENILDQSFDIPSPSSSIPLDSASIMSTRTKSTTPLPQQVVQVGEGSPQSKTKASANSGEGSLKSGAIAHQLRKSTSEDILSRSHWNQTDPFITPLKSVIPSSSTSPSIADKENSIHGNRSPLEPSIILPVDEEDDSHDDGGSDSDGDDDVSDGDDHQPVSNDRDEDETQNVATGWTPVVATVVWLRMIGILGDIGQTPLLTHLKDVLKELERVWISLEKIEQNSGISLDNQPTPPLPKWLPPLLIFVPWTLSVGSHFDMSSIACCQLAHEILCRTMVRRWLVHPNQCYLNSFYAQVKRAIANGRREIAPTIVKFSSQLFSYEFPGSTVLLGDLVTGCHGVLKDDAVRGPRCEALVLMNAILPLLEENSILRDEIVSSLKKAACIDPVVDSRRLAIQQIGIVVFTSLKTGPSCRDLLQLVNIVVASAKFSNESVAMAAIDVLSLWVDLQPVLPAKAVETVFNGLCAGIAQFAKERESLPASSVLGGLLMCLRDWLIATPLPWLLQAHLLEQSLMILSSLAFGSSLHLPVGELTFGEDNQVELGPVHYSQRHRATSGSGGSSRVPFDTVDTEDPSSASARAVLSHLLTFLDHYPLLSGPAQLTSSVGEGHSEQASCCHGDINDLILSSPKMQFFMVGDSSMLTISEILEVKDGPQEVSGSPQEVSEHRQELRESPQEVRESPQEVRESPQEVKEHPQDVHDQSHDQVQVTGASEETAIKGLVKGDSFVRLIIREVSGKMCWDASPLLSAGIDHSAVRPTVTIGEDSSVPQHPEVVTAQEMDTGSVITSSHDSHMLPSWSTWTKDGDILDQLLYFVTNTSPECLLHPGHSLNEPAPCSSMEREDDELAMLELLEMQDQLEGDFWRDAVMLPCPSSNPQLMGVTSTKPTHFSPCRQFLSHFGWLDLQKRSTLDHLNRDQQLIRQLKFLDNANSQSRQIYKMAVLYVAPGQEDQNSILSNTNGSKQFEEFVSGLGWEVNLATHQGYMGGLRKDFTHNMTAPYYATSSEEAFFHVSTRMGGTLEQKIRHLGNDHVHIVWSEHYRDYRKSIFRTQFADVLLILYPLKSGRCRVHVIKKPKVPAFGPLFDGALVPFNVLPALVRSTAINASLRIRRQTTLSFKGRYSERQSYLKKNIRVHQSFESFALNNVHPCDTPLGGATPEGTVQPKHSHIRTAESVRDIPSDVTPSLRQRANTFTEGTTSTTQSPGSLEKSGDAVMSSSTSKSSLPIEEYDNSPKLNRH